MTNFTDTLIDRPPPDDTAVPAPNPALQPKSPLVQRMEGYVGKIDDANADAQREFDAQQRETAPLKGKILSVLQSPNDAKLHLEKVKQQPKPEDYKKYSMEFASAMALIGAIGGRLTSASGNAALNAFSGAIMGWQKGNLEAYETKAKEWDQAARKTLENNNMELEKYKTVMANKKANIDQMMAALNLIATEHQNKIMFDMTQAKNYTAALGLVDKISGVQDRLEGAINELTGLRGNQKQEVKSQVDALNRNPALISQMKLEDYLKLKGAADTFGFKLVDPPPGAQFTGGKPVNPQVQLLSEYTTEHPGATAEDKAKFMQTQRPPRSAAAMAAAQFQRENPNATADQMLAWNAKQTGMAAAARTGATREQNLITIINAADAAVPAAIEASSRVSRVPWVPLERLIQHGEVMTSDPELMQFGMANLQLAEHWARAMNPTGVMRESDRDLALSFLNTATSHETYIKLVNQLRTQIQREKDAIVKGMQQGLSAPAVPQATEATTDVTKYDSNGNRIK